MTIYSKCVNCGKKKTPTTANCCSGECTREYREKITKLKEKTHEYISNNLGTLLSKPIVLGKLGTEISKQTGLSKHMVGVLLEQFRASGYFDIYPNKYHCSDLKVCHLRSDRERAVKIFAKLHKEKYENLSDGIKSKLRDNRKRLETIIESLKWVYV